MTDLNPTVVAEKVNRAVLQAIAPDLLAERDRLAAAIERVRAGIPHWRHPGDDDFLLMHKGDLLAALDGEADRD